MEKGNNPALAMILFAIILICGKQFLADTWIFWFFLEIILVWKKTVGQIESMGYNLT